ncbi:MAG: DarT ssDNA thymidine ADP-ribosyltransferase family protein, partial [Leptospirillia bacterium]
MEPPTAKEGKQAEFLVREFFPWHLIRRIGVVNEAIKTHVLGILDREAHQPMVEVRREWY